MLLSNERRMLMRFAMQPPGLKIVFGSDALAGLHGRNAEEFIDRVRDLEVDLMAAMVSANSLGTEALGMADQIYNNHTSPYLGVFIKSLRLLCHS